MKRILDRLFFDHWKAIDALRTPGHAGKVDWRPLVILSTVAVSLTIQNYWGERPVFTRMYPRHEAAWAGKYYDLYQFAWWTGWRFDPVLLSLLRGL